MKLKFCGLRNEESFDFAIENKLDFVGINFVQKSKRYIYLNNFFDQEFSSFKANFPGKIVGVFQNKEVNEIIEISKKYDLDIIQLHQKITSDEALELQKTGAKIWLAIQNGNENLNQEITNIIKFSRENKIDLWLFDGAVAGSGKSILNLKNLSQEIAKLDKEGLKYGIAGGINTANIADFKQYFPKAKILDMASGLERNGKFSQEKASEILQKFKK
jgi:phosphoribosylanthranilate isomerase